MKRKYEVDPLRGSILKNMLLFALPIMGAALLQMLFSCTDTIVIGRFGHENAISAIGVSAAMLNLLVGSLTALEAGVTVVVGTLYGRGDRERIHTLLQSLPLTAVILGLGLTVPVLCLCDPILRLLNCPAAFFADARYYFCIYFLGVPFMVVFNFLAAVLQAKGNSFVPFIFQIGASVVNIGLNLLFVIAFDWNVAGVAISTAFSQLLSAGGLVLYLTRQTDETHLELRRLTAFRETRQVFALGVPSALEGAVLNLSGVIISAAINRFPSAVIAGNTVATTIEGIMCIAFVGFSNASVVFISQNDGNGDLKRVKQTYRTTMLAVFCGAEALGILIYLLSPQLTALFTTDPAIMECARVRMFYMCLFFGLCGTMNVISGCIRGLNEAKLPLAISLLCSVAFRITWIYTYARWAGTIESIYVSYPICWGLCTGLSMLAFGWVFRRRARELEAATLCGANMESEGVE